MFSLMTFGSHFPVQSVLESCIAYIQALKSHKKHQFVSDAMPDLFHNNFSFSVTITNFAGGTIRQS